MDHYVDIRWTSEPLHGRKSRPCARYLRASACTDAVLIQVGTIVYKRPRVSSTALFFFPLPCLW